MPSTSLLPEYLASLGKQLADARKRPFGYLQCRKKQRQKWTKS